MMAIKGACMQLAAAEGVGVGSCFFFLGGGLVGLTRDAPRSYRTRACDVHMILI
jgi:tetrahydromethanopterin S-methyltransferase subunit D